MSQLQAAIASAGDAEQAIAALHAIMNELEQTLTEETERLRAGRLRDALALAPTKADLAGRFTVESERVRAAQRLIAGALPDALDTLRQRHAAFQALLQKNLTVLATAHAVSEGIIRGVSGELTRKRAPSTYGASGRANGPSQKASLPLALSRTL
jgi:hypothetical protein